MLVQQNKQIKNIEQKSETIDIKNEILLALEDPVVCGCNLNPSKLLPLGSKSPIEFTTSTSEFSLPEGLRTDCNFSTQPFLKSNKITLSNMKIDAIKVTNLSRVDTTSTWNGRLTINFSNTIIKLKDLSIPIRIESTGTGPFQVDTCRLSAGSNGSVDFNQCRTITMHGNTEVIVKCSQDEAIISGSCVFSSVQNSFFVDSQNRKINYQPGANGNDPKGFGCGWNPGVNTYVTAMCCKKN